MIVYYLRRKQFTTRIPKIKDDGHPQKGPDTHYAELEVDSEALRDYTEPQPRNDHFSSIEAAGRIYVNIQPQIGIT